MNGLRDIVKFVSREDEHLGSMRGVPNFVPVLSGNERVSMRAMIAALQRLPPITLEAEGENTNGEVPLMVGVTVHPSAGVVRSTTTLVTQNGRVVGGPTSLPNQLETSGFNAVTPGQYIFNITREGVANTGFTTLQKDIFINASGHPVTPPVTPPLVPPTISSVTSSGAGLNSVFTVVGSGFLPNANVGIKVADDALNPPLNIEFDSNGQRIRSNGEGKLNAKINVACNSGLGLHFSATDGRAVPDSVDHTGVLHSNTFNSSCP
jgi:hypothetical protein